MRCSLPAPQLAHAAARPHRIPPVPQPARAATRRARACNRSLPRACNRHLRRLVLASDGLWDVVDEQMCGNACARATDPLDAARTLCELASTRGSMDNITVLVVAL